MPQGLAIVRLYHSTNRKERSYLGSTVKKLYGIRTDIPLRVTSALDIRIDVAKDNWSDRARTSGSRHKGWTMDPDIFCQLTRTDGSTVEIWLPARQVEVITDVDNPHRMAIFEALDIVSIETDEAVKDSAERLSDTDFRASHAPRSAAG